MPNRSIDGSLGAIPADRFTKDQLEAIQRGEALGLPHHLFCNPGLTAKELNYLIDMMHSCLTAQRNPDKHFVAFNGVACNTDYGFKSWDNYRNRPDSVCYVPEDWDFEENGPGYTANDILAECGGDKDKADIVFELCSWQHPSTVLGEWDRDDDIALRDKKLEKIQELDAKIEPEEMPTTPSQSNPTTPSIPVPDKEFLTNFSVTEVSDILRKYNVYIQDGWAKEEFSDKTPPVDVRTFYESGLYAYLSFLNQQNPSFGASEHGAISPSEPSSDPVYSELCEVKKLHENTPAGVIRDADTILTDSMQAAMREGVFEESGLFEDLFRTYEAANDKQTVKEMFFLFTNRSLEEYLETCKRDISRPVSEHGSEAFKPSLMDILKDIQQGRGEGATSEKNREPVTRPKEEGR